MVLGVSPLKGAEKAPGALIAGDTVTGWVYGPPSAVPHAKDTVTLAAVPLEVRVPFRVAEVVVGLLAAFVVTNGDVGTVVKDVSADQGDQAP